MKRTLLTLTIAALVTQCSATKVDNRNRGNKQSADQVVEPTTPVNIELQSEEANGLALLARADINAFDATLRCDNNIQRFNVSPYFVAGELVSCRVELDKFAIGDESFLPVQNFVTFTAGEEALFKGSNERIARVLLEGQIASNLKSDNTARFKISIVEAGENAQTDIAEGEVEITGDEAASLTLISSITTATNLLPYFQCDAPIVGNTYETASCLGDSLSGIKFYVEPLAEDISLNFITPSFIDSLIAGSTPNIAFFKNAVGQDNGGLSPVIKLERIAPSTPTGLPGAYLIIIAKDGSNSYKHQKIVLNQN